MLVYVAAERLAELRGNARERWTIRHDDLLDRDLLRSPGWALYVATVRDDRARVIAYLEHVAVDREELGDAPPCDLDITPLLGRLGCDGGAGSFSTWAARPRVLTPGDTDLLRYRLGLPLGVAAPPPLPPPPPRSPPAPTIGFVHDEIAMKLLAAVYEDLTSDATRMVLADRLLELGDLRGEMMALQLARAHSGAPATLRERELIAQHGATWLGRLAECLSTYEFRRGFLATTGVADSASMWPRWYEHPAWATVEELETGSPTLLLSPSLRSLRRVAINGSLLATLARHTRPLTIETIVGRLGERHNAGDALRSRFGHGGIEFSDRGDLQPLFTNQVLDRLRSMSISIARANGAMDFLETGLGRRLEHIELFAPDLAAVDPEAWRRVYVRNQPLSLGLRGIVGGWSVIIVRHRRSIVVQLGDPARASQPYLAPIVPVIASLGEGLGAVTIEQIGEDGLGVDLQPAVEPLRRAFVKVELASAQRWRSL
jgi:hypothetical protein